MPKLTPLSRKEFIKKLKGFGLQGPFQGGDHQFMCNKNCRIKVPNSHSKKDIPIFIIQLTIRQLGKSKDEWINKK